jgi:tRNA(fMet)-specific endonuclease VapC
VKVLLDTDVCIELIRHRPATLLAAITVHPPGDVGISAVTAAELEYGVVKSSRPAKNRDALRQFLSPFEVASFDAVAAAAYGGVRAALEAKGHSIGAMDLLIAAHALSLDVELMTGNAREFARVPGLRIRRAPAR